MTKKLFRLPYILCYLSAFILGVKQLREPDIWWQLLSGRWMLEHGEITRNDMFSFTMQGNKWVNVKWLYEIFIALIEKLLGPHGIMLLQAFVNIAIVYLLLHVILHISRKLGQQVSGFFTLFSVILFLSICEFRMAGRPEMTSHLFTAAYLLILWRDPVFNWRKSVLLILLQILWTNMHEGYPVGIVIVGCFIAGALFSFLITKEKNTLKTAGGWIITIAGMLLIMVLNPNGTLIWTHTFEIFRQLSVNKYTTELYSATQAEYWNARGWIHVAIAVFVISGWLYRIISERKQLSSVYISPPFISYLIMVAVMLVLSFTASRNIPFAQIVMLPSVPLLLSWLLQKTGLSTRKFYLKLSARTAIACVILAATFYVSVAGNRFYKLTGSVNKYGLHVDMFRNPTGAADFIRTHKLKGPAFSDYFISSYLLWDLYPQFKSYIDLRDLDVFSEKFFNQYFDLYYEPEKFHELDSIYKFNYVVISTSQLTNLQQILYWQDGFNVMYVDPVSIILVRVTKENELLNNGPESRKLFYWPQEIIDPAWATAITTLFNPLVNYDEEDETLAPMYAAKFYNSVSNFRIALKILRPVIGNDLADNAEALSTMGSSYLGDATFTSATKEEKSVKLDSARMYFEMAMKLDDRIKDTYVGLASLAMEDGNLEGAIKHLESYLELDKKNDYIYYLIAMTYRNLWKLKNNPPNHEQIITNLQKAKKLNPNNKRTYLYMAESYWHTGDKDNARQNMRTAMLPGTRFTAYERSLMDTLRQNLGIKEPLPPMEILQHEHHH